MIRFVCGRAGSGKSEYIMDAVKSGGNARENVILIVPEQQAVAWESRTAAELDPKSLLSLEVLTFTRLSDRVFREYGGFFHNCATKAAKRLLLWTALESVRESLNYYSGARSERLVPALLKTVKELHTYRVTPSMLEEAADSLGKGDNTEILLSQKLGDISLIYGAYDELLHNSFDDSEELPERTAGIVAEKGFFKGKTVFIDSFYSYTPAQRDIIKSAMSDAKDVTVTFCCPVETTAEPQFRHIREYFDRLKSLAAELGGYETVSLEEQRRFRTPALGVLETYIWDFAKKDSEVCPDGINLIITEDRYSEGDAAAAQICRLVRDGARYSDIAVIARSTESLEGITDAALQRRGIPHYTSRRHKLEQSPVARLLTAALRIPAFGWRREDILTIAKTGLLSFDEGQCELFEKYTQMWRIRGEYAYMGDGDWGMDPFGYKQSSEERVHSILDAVNSARRKICDPLSAFCEVFDGGRTTAEKCAAALYWLLCDWAVPEAIAEMAGRLRELGYTTEAAECLRMWDALMSVLDTLATAIPDAAGDAESFSVMLSQIISATDVGTIPTGIDEVALGSADLMRTENPRHVIIIGAVADEFPAKTPSDGILSETDRVMLEGCGIELSDSGRNAAGMELFLFYKAISAASESVTVIIPETTGTSGCSPSIGAMRIQELFPNALPVRYSPDDLLQSVWVRDDLERFVRRRGASGECARMLLPESADVPLYGEDTSYNSESESIPLDVMKRIYGDTVYLSQSKLDRFAQCPFMYSADYTLRLENDSAGRIDPSDTGSFVHKILEEFFRETADMDFPIPEETEREICDRLFDEYVKALASKGAVSGRQRFLFKRLRRSIGVFIRSLNLEFSQGLFRPWRFEQPVGTGSHDSIPAPVFNLSDGTQIRMRGYIDRIDTLKHAGNTYVRVVDYKTGSKNFKLSDIYKGLNLQLLLYLFTIWKSPPGEFRAAIAGDGDIIPAGALYFSARPGESRSDRMLYGDDGMEIALTDVSRTGVVLSDMDILSAMDKEFSGIYAPAKLNKDGELRESEYLADAEKFGKLYLDISDIIKEMGEKITGGFAGAVPKEHGGKMPCDYCAYYPICRKNEVSAEEEE